MFLQVVFHILKKKYLRKSVWRGVTMLTEKLHEFLMVIFGVSLTLESHLKSLVKKGINVKSVR